jgi:predicted TIM-barrel fold metal-dependent hydrolase
MAANPAPGPGAGLIDVHHHIVPPFYLAENGERIAASRGGRISPAWREWTPDKALAAMDRHGIATAVISLSTPGVWFGDAERARDTARRCNEYAADLARRHPGRFGRFAAVPLPDPDASLREIEYACDALGAEGVGLLTSYGDRWLGDPAYDSVLTELDRRQAVVFVHPTTPTCCRNILPEVAPQIAEVPQDTARAIVNMLFAGTLARCRNIRFIFAHAGGTLSMVAGRIPQYGPPDLASKAPHGVDHELARLHYDIAGTAYRPAVAALRALVPTSQILLGSDHPYVPLGETMAGLPALGLTAADLAAIGRDNALRLLPTLGRP